MVFGCECNPVLVPPGLLRLQGEPGLLSLHVSILYSPLSSSLSLYVPFSTQAYNSCLNLPSAGIKGM